MIFHANRLPADDSHEISCLIHYFRKSSKILNCHLLQNIGIALRVNAEFLYIFVSLNNYVVGTHLKHLHATLPMSSTMYICILLRIEIRKNITIFRMQTKTKPSCLKL